MLYLFTCWYHLIRCRNTTPTAATEIWYQSFQNDCTRPNNISRDLLAVAILHNTEQDLTKRLHDL